MDSIVVRRRWFPVPDYEGFYEVSDLGEVRNVGYVLRGRYRKRVPPRSVRSHPAGPNTRVRRVTLTKEGRRAVFTVGELVLRAMRGPPPIGMKYVTHTNGDVTDNRLVNLHWGNKRAADNQEEYSEIELTTSNLRHQGQPTTLPPEG